MSYLEAAERCWAFWLCMEEGHRYEVFINKKNELKSLEQIASAFSKSKSKSKEKFIFKTAAGVVNGSTPLRTLRSLPEWTEIKTVAIPSTIWDILKVVPNGTSLLCRYRARNVAFVVVINNKCNVSLVKDYSQEADPEDPPLSFMTMDQFIYFLMDINFDAGNFRVLYSTPDELTAADKRYNKGFISISQSGFHIEEIADMNVPLSSRDQLIPGNDPLHVRRLCWVKPNIKWKGKWEE